MAATMSFCIAGVSVLLVTLAVTVTVGAGDAWAVTVWVIVDAGADAPTWPLQAVRNTAHDKPRTTAFVLN